jgi:predicted extracellular nuclease
MGILLSLATAAASTATVTPSPTATPPPPGSIRIHDIQGTSHISPLRGTAVANVPGIVTVTRANGYYLQDPSPDANDATSEGIFVFTSSSPAVDVGDAVLVSGTVAEFRPGGSDGLANLTTTEITSPTTTVTSSGNAMPTPVVIGAGGRVPPSMVIDDDAMGDVETSGAFDPATDGIDFYESLEGMLAQVDNAVAVGPRQDFSGSNEIVVLGDGGSGGGVRTSRGGIVIRANDFNPERIVVQGSTTTLPAVNVGDHFTGPIVGVVDYSFGNFKLAVASVPTVRPAGLGRESTTAAGSDQLAIATFNVENLDPSDGAGKFNVLADLIVSNLRAPDLVVLEEVQDNNGATNNAVVDATDTYHALITTIVTAGGPAYQFRNVNPVDDQDGGEPGGNIRVGFLFRTDRGLAFVDRDGPGDESTTPITVSAGPDGPQLSASPGRIDPGHPAFEDSRKPLAGEFTFNGRKLFVVGNHFTSKGGDHSLFAHFQPPVLSSEAKRAQQAQIVNDFVDRILALDANANVVVLGDLNDFEFSTPVDTLEGGALFTLIETLPAAERYSYVFEGNSQALDHILVSSNLFHNVPFEYDVVHVNAEFFDQVSDHDPQVVRFFLPPPTATATPAAAGVPFK